MNSSKSKLTQLAFITPDLTMDNDIACDDIMDIKSDDVDIKQRRVLKTSRRRFNIESGQLEILEKAFSEAPHIDTEKAVELSAFVGLPYYKIKKWFSNRRLKSRRLLDSENPLDCTEGMEGHDAYRPAPTRIPACLPLKRLRNDNDLSTDNSFQNFSNIPMIPKFQPTSKPTRQDQQMTSHQKQEHQQMAVGVKQQTITQQIHTQPLCWPPLYNANPSFNFDTPSMSRILVDYLKENPHLLTPVQPTKRRRVECEIDVPKCEDSIFDKVKRWFMTMEPPTSETTTDEQVENLVPETEIFSSNKLPRLSKASSSERKSETSRHTTKDPSCHDKSPDLMPDDVSIMLESYTKDSHCGLSDDRTSDVEYETLSGFSGVTDTEHTNPYSEGRSDLSDVSSGCPVSEGQRKDIPKEDATCFEVKSLGQNEENLVNLP